jgi:hypothetical protein
MWIDETFPVCCGTEVPKLRGQQLYRLREGAQLCCHLLWQMRLPGRQVAVGSRRFAYTRIRGQNRDAFASFFKGR